MDIEKLKSFLRALPTAGLGWDFASGATREVRWAAQKIGGRIRMEMETKDGEYFIDYIELTYDMQQMESNTAAQNDKK